MKKKLLILAIAVISVVVMSCVLVGCESVDKYTDTNTLILSNELKEKDATFEKVSRVPEDTSIDPTSQVVKMTATEMNGIKTIDNGINYVKGQKLQVSLTTSGEKFKLIFVSGTTAYTLIEHTGEKSYEGLLELPAELVDGEYTLRMVGVNANYSVQVDVVLK